MGWAYGALTHFLRNEKEVEKPLPEKIKILNETSNLLYQKYLKIKLFTWVKVELPVPALCTKDPDFDQLTVFKGAYLVIV